MISEQAPLADRLDYHIRYTLAKERDQVTAREVFQALALACGELLTDRWFETSKRYRRHRAKRLYYLSMEFLLGRSLANNLRSLGIYDQGAAVVSRLGFELADILEEEPDPALGNGGLGRLAACFLDSLATLDLPGYGYGINYEFGLFKQVIEDGRQKERPDHWLAQECPWQVAKPDEACFVPTHGHVHRTADRHGEYNPMWMDWDLIVGVPHDVPIVGHGGRTVNCLRLYSARSSTEFDIQIFNQGDYLRAVQRKIESESVSKVLYPQDETISGKELRLLQEYFLVACSLRDILTRHKREGYRLEELPEFVAIQMNDTHPSLAVAELLRLLVDEGSLEWNQAWEITQATCAYTNHTLLPEALEKWPADLLERVLPRHLEIIGEIDRRFLAVAAARWPGDNERLRRMGVFDDSSPRQVRMAHLAVVGSHAVNGVSELHSELIKTSLLRDFHELWPERFSNKTNGVSHRRWLLSANPRLADVLTHFISGGWVTDPARLIDLEKYADDPDCQERFRAVKRANKESLARMIQRSAGVSVDVDSIFDVHAKRIHEYKRQLLNILNVVHQYLRIVDDGWTPPAAQTFIFAGKAAPGYYMAKLVIQLIHAVAEAVNEDPKASEWLRVVFIPDYRVSLAEVIIPAADLSEQISTVGQEASGTGVMKFALNGALTLGTLDGANIEMAREIGEDNMFVFGMSPAQMAQRSAGGGRPAFEFYRDDASIRRVLDAIAGDRFSLHRPRLFQPVLDRVLDPNEPYFHLADFEPYADARMRAGGEYANTAVWTRKVILNVARMGRFSSDRTIREYAAGIWNIRPVGEQDGGGLSAEG